MAIFAIALVVIDTDGSAFITKAEFDSLKNNFQAQIDNYNNSIDSKIDGAIAAYLAGIKTAVEKYNTTLGYNASGVLSVLPYENIDWEEGDISISFDITNYAGDRDNNSYYTGYEHFVFPARGVRVGHLGPSECLVTTLNRNNSTGNVNAALWRGKYINNKIDFKCFGYKKETSGLFKPLGTQGSGDNKIYFRNNLMDQSATSPTTPLARGWFHKVNGKKFDMLGDSSGTFFFGTYWGRTPVAETSSLSAYTSQCNIKRTLGTQTIPVIISASKLNTFSRFTDYDEFWELCNDTRFDGHSLISSETEIFGDPQFDAAVYDGTTTQKGPFTPAWGDPMVDTTPYIDWIKNNMSSDTAQSCLYPYVGFAKNLTNFNKIYTDKYSDFVQDIISIHPGISVYNDTKRNQKHVNVGAGFIFGKVEENDLVKIPIKFGDQTKSYDIWLRIGPFTPTKSAWEEDGYEDIYTDEQCLTLLPLGAHPNSRVVSGAEQYIYLKPKTSGYLFMMWTYNDINKNGGGVFLPYPNYIIVSDTK